MSSRERGTRTRTILHRGQTCWRVEHAERAAFLVDGAAYFAAFRAAARQARRSIVVVGWDIDSRVRLRRSGDEDDGLPDELGGFLDELAARSSELEIFLLDWDFSMLYAAEREPFPIYQLGWRSHPRVRFHLDGTHPLGASHHQKIVVVDNAVAFVGGFDLTHHRWDTPAHAPDDARRRGPDGQPYPPFHDLQMLVDGDAAAALGELAAERWRRATGHRLPDSRPDSTPWPSRVTPDLTDVLVGIARTEPEHDSRPAVREVERLYLSTIDAARRSLYVESQYFSSAAVGSALSRRLADDHPPEMLLVSRRRDSGWLEEKTMGVLRERQHQRLRAADRHRRYRSVYPHIPGLAGCVNVHAKLLIADDDVVTIGSANLSNRSMGLDTECVLAIDGAGDARVSAAIAALRHRLLAEHTGTTPEDVARMESGTGSLLAAVDHLSHDGRSLRTLDPAATGELPAWALDGMVVDPEQPIDPDAIVADLLPPEESSSVTARLVAMGLVLIAALGLAAAWRWTPLAEWLDVEAVADFGRAAAEWPGAPVLVLGAHVAAGLLVIPVTILVAATVLVFGPWAGLAYALGGSVLSAAVTYAIGRSLGRDFVRRLAGRRLNRLSRQLARRGLLAVVTVRLVPLAPFTIVNIVAGAMRVSWHDFLLGTALGLLPGALVIGLFVDRVVAQLRDPGAGSLLALVALTLTVLAAAALVSRLQRSRPIARSTA